jgi:hypothetical protein
VADVEAAEERRVQVAAVAVEERHEMATTADPLPGLHLCQRLAAAR